MYSPRGVRPQEFQMGAGASQYGPTRLVVTQVRSKLAELGVRAIWHSGDAWMTSMAGVSTIDHVFHVSVHRYLSPGGTHYVASAVDPTVPSNLHAIVTGAGRISTYVWLHKADIPSGGLKPTDILKAYDIAPLRVAGIDGSGQTIVFPEIDGIDITAIARFAGQYHLPPFRLTIHGAKLSPGSEATMDVEVAHAIAPKARLEIYNFNPQTDNAGWNRQTEKMVNASRGAVISESVGGCEGGYDSTDARDYASVLARADLLGESMFASSGDNGAYDCLSHGEAPSSAYLGVEVPASLPGVTAVGGTRISVRRDGAWFRETVWSGPVETSGSGGGVSSFFHRPWWQAAPGVPLQRVTNRNGMRMVPDVSADADPASGAAIIDAGGSHSQGGGTSQAVPIWAGITALINEYLARHGHRSIGWMNPALYYLARSHDPYPPFHDITVGTNLYYTAGPGYDMTTGLGSPDAWNLARDLSAYQSNRRQ